MFLTGSLKKFASGGVMLLMLTLSVATPLVERADLDQNLVVESEHDPASCPPGHDHTVCTQVSSNLSALVGGQVVPTPHAGHRLPGFDAETGTLTSSVVASHRSRAPPLT